MSYNISKELFEAVIDFHIEYILIENRKIMYEFKTIPAYYTRSDDIFINDFFFKCKEWAKSQRYYLCSFPSDVDDTYNCSIDTDIEGFYDEQITNYNRDSEQQAVFDACEWILENKDR